MLMLVSTSQFSECVVKYIKIIMGLGPNEIEMFLEDVI